MSNLLAIMLCWMLDGQLRTGTGTGHISIIVVMNASQVWFSWSYSWSAVHPSTCAI